MDSRTRAGDDYHSSQGVVVTGRYARVMLPTTGSVTVAGHRLVYDQYGSGERTVVLLHGLLMRRFMHAPLIAVLDELGVESAVVGGTSLGANVALEIAIQAPDRVCGMVLDMPVLEDSQ